MTSVEYGTSETELTEVGVRVLIVDLSQKFGGASSRVLTLMRNLPVGQVTLAALENSPIAVEAIRLGLPVIFVGASKVSPIILFKLISLIRSGGYQVLDTQNPQSKFWGSIAAWMTDVPLVSTLNSWYADEHGTRSLKGMFYAFLELGTNFALDKYVVVSQAIFDALVRYRVDRSRIQLIRNAVDTGHDVISSSESALKKKYNIPTDSLVMVAVGRLVWAKGYEDLVDAFRLVADENPEVYCIIAGDGELAPIIRAKIEAAGLSDRIILLGHVSRDDVLSLMTWCDIFVMSSRSEGTPMVILEAASLKKPILATKVGGIPDMLADEEECLLVPAGNPPALAKGMKRLLSDSQFSERLAQAAYFRVIRDFSVISQAESMISVYKDAWQERKLV